MERSLLNAGTSTINLTGNNPSFSPGIGFGGGAGLTYYDLNVPGPCKSASIRSAMNFHNVNFATDGEIYSSCTFNNLTFSPNHAYTLTNGTTQTINGSLSATATCTTPITLKSSTPSIQATINSPNPVSVAYLNIRDMKATGASFTANNCFNQGNNTGWTFVGGGGGQNLYWIGGTGNWNDGNHWSLTSGGAPLGCSPGIPDNVFFDLNSFTTASQIVTINVTANCNDMTWTGVTHTPTLAGASSNPISIYGSLTLTAAMNMTYAGVVNFEAASTGKTITTGGKSFANAINFNGVGGGWTLQDIFATPNGTITLNGGALNSNGQTVNCSSFASTVATPRGLVMGSSVFNVSYISFTSWQVYAPGLTLNAGTSTINLTGNNPSFSPGIGFGGGGGLTYYDLNFPGPCKSGLIQSAMNFHNVSFATDGVISASCTFNNLTFSPNHNYTLTNGTTQTINGSLSATGTCTGPITIKSSTGGSQATINSPNPVSVSYVSIKDIKATGAAFTASNSNDQGNNTGWTFGGGGGQNLYWIGGTGNWNDGNHWSLTSGGAIFGCSPGAADNVFFDLNSFNATSQIVTINVTAACNDMTWTGVTNTPTLAGVSSNPISIYGSLTLTAAMNMTYAGVVNFEAASTGKTITTGGKSFANAINFNGIGGGWILQDVFSTPNGTITLNGGTLNSNGQTVNCSSFTSTVATPRGLIMGSSVFNVSYISFTSWQVYAPGLTLNAGTSTINLTGNNLSFSPGIGFGGGGGLTYYDLNFPGPCKSGLIQSAMNFHNVSFATDGVISASCTFNNLTFSPGHEYTLTNGTTQTINGDLNISGSGGFPIRIQSSVAGSRATFSKSSGTVCADYIRISDNQATGGATFNAGTNSQDLGNNIGWNFPGMSTAPSSLNVSVNPLCNTGTQQTHLTQTGGTLGNLAYWQWYSNDLYTIPVGGQLATSDAGLDVSPLITTTYYIRAEWPECISPLPGPPSGITVTVNPLPSAPLSGGNVVICSNDAPGTISATSAGNEIDWYDMSAGGGLLQSNSSTYATSVANTYFAESRNSTTTCVSAIRTPVTLTINNSPVAFNVSGGACVPATMGLTGSEVGVNYQLYRNTNIPVGSIVSGTGNTISFGPQNVPGIYSVVATNAINGCISDMIGVSTVAICTSTWLGTTDTSWFTQTNWDPAAIPNNCASNVVIPVGTPYSPTITGSNVTIGNMDIASGAVLSLLGQNLNVCGNWKGGAGSNAAVVGSGTVVMNSSSGSQSISDNTQFNILQINNADGVHLNSGADVSINNGLHLQLGDLDVSAAALILKSNSSNHNSYIDDFTTGFAGTLTGAIRAERYIPTLGSNQHFMSSPVNSPLLSQLGASGPDGSYVTPYPTCDETKSNWGSAYGTTFVYNDGHMSSGGCMLGNWMIKSGGNMDNGRGYSTYQKGDTTRTLVGAANTGNINIGGLNNSGYPTVNTLQAQPIHSGWNLVGNPYPSALDLTIDRTADGFGDQVQVWHTTGPFSGVWLPVVIDGNSGTVVIAPFQAFMVRVIPGSLGNHTYHFYQSERVRSTNVQFHRVDAANALKLELNYANGGKDETRIAFSSEATINFDNKLDANKPGSASGVPTLYTHMNTNMWYGINTLPSLTEVTTVPMGLRTDMNGTMTITPQGIQSFDPTTYILLEDKKTDTWHNLRNGSYTFTASKTDNQDRFVLHFTPPANILTTDASCSGSGQIEITQPGNANWNYTITDVNSTTISSGQLNSGNPMTISANSGVYQLTLTDNSGYTVMKKIEVKGIQPIVASFAASVTLAEVNEEINFSATTTNVATYHWDFGDGNTATTKNATHFYRAEGSYSINLTVINSTGCKSNTTQTVNITSRGATGISTMLTIKPIHIWSSENMVYVDFTNQKGVQAEIALYNLLGEVISCEKFVNASVYKKQITDLQAAYIIVRVKNEESVTTKKVFIVNN